MTVSSPDDALEREADRAAEEMLAQKSSKVGCSACGDKKPAVQRIATTGASQDAESAPPVVERALQSSAGHALDEQTRAFFEPQLGLDLSGVRVHTGALADESSKAVDAKAYTVGRDIVFGAGHYAPHTHEGQRVLGHELTHVAQQGGASNVVHRILLGGGYRQPPIPDDVAKDFSQCNSVRESPVACRSCCSNICFKHKDKIGTDLCINACIRAVPCASAEGEKKPSLREVLVILGISILLLALIAAALLDPEPASKVAAIVGSLALANQLLILLGMKPKDKTQPSA